MSFKLKQIFVVSVFVISLFSYKINNVHATTYDVAKANGPVKFTFNLAESIPFIGANVSYDLGYKGQDSYVAVVDTGVDVSHPFLQGRVALEACFAASCPNGSTSMVGPGAAKPVHWHGTHVAGIVAGYNSGFHGIAPQAKIIAVNVFDSSGAAYDADIIRALNWINSISNQYNISSVNMSLGGQTTFTTTCDSYIPDLTTAINNLRAKNIATVVASGNSYSYGMSSPACISSAVSVAAVYKNSTAITDYSNVNKYTTFSAPGHQVTSSVTGGLYQSASGTSMATPFVAGAFAVYRSKFGVQSVDKVVSDFKNASKQSLDSYTNISVSRIDLTSLFASAPITTTSTSTTSTTIPTTTTTVVSTTTTIPDVVTTTTTLPVVTTTVPPSTTTTLAPPTQLPYIPNPMLLELNGIARNFVWVKYRDPYMNKSFVDHYELFCNNKNIYTVPRESMYSIHSYKLDVLATSIDYCYFYGVTIYGTKTKSTSKVNIYPKNKTTPNSIKLQPSKKKN